MTKFTQAELILIQRALWNRVDAIDTRDMQLADSGVSSAEIYERRHHLHDEVFALIERVGDEIMKRAEG